MLKTTQYIILIILAFTANDILAQEEWKLYNTANSGIGGNFVEDIEVDGQGVIWIAGWDELSRFNGQDWDVFDIPHHILDLELMNSGNILIGTTQGLFEFDTESFEIITDHNANIPFDHIECVSVDQDDNIWIGYGITNHRIAHHNGTNWVEHTSNITSTSFTVYSIDCFENHVWAGIGNALHHYDGNAWERFDEWNSPIPGDMLVLETKCDSTGKIWVGTSSGTVNQNVGRLITYDLNNWTSTDSSDCSFIWNGVCSIAFLDSTYWFTSYWNGFVYNDLSTYHMYDENNSIIPTHYANAVATDRQRNVFMGTGDGLVVYNENRINIDAYRYDELMFCYPVPVTNKFKIAFYLPESQPVDFHLFNSSGGKILDQTNVFESGKNIYEIDISNLSMGVYFVQMIYGATSGVKKIVKMN